MPTPHEHDRTSASNTEQGRTSSYSETSSLSLAVTRWVMGVIASLLVFGLGWVISASHQQGETGARIAALEKQSTINSGILATQQAQDVRLAALEHKMDGVLTREEHIVFYNQTLEALRDIRSEQIRLRSALEEHDKRDRIDHPK